MTRNKNLKQTKGGDTDDAHQLLNFHFSRAAPPAAQTARPRSGSTSSSGRRNQPQQQQPRRNHHQKKNQYDRRTAEDRASARRKAAANMFPLHSSADHAFVIARRGPNNHNHTFQGPDQAVSWECVKIVKQLLSVEQRQQQSSLVDETNHAVPSCPICLDDLQCPRVTKCGHCFCLPCLIHHVQSVSQTHQQQASPKCPCCAIPLHLEDVRPVQFVTVLPPHQPVAGCTMKFVKLHRVRDCPTPYLPLPSQPRRGWAVPYAAPCQIDADAAYSRFVYVHPESYRTLLQDNCHELLALQQQQQQQSMLEELCIHMALQMVQNEQTLAANCASEEWQALEQFQSAGILYQPQPRHLMAAAATAPLAAACSIDGTSSSSSSWDDKPERRQPDAAACRDRGDSIASYDGGACTSHNSSSSGSPRRPPARGGSMYMTEEEEYVFYQAEDGSLCFLSGFNMKCLQTEFAAATPLPVAAPSSSEVRVVSDEIQNLSMSQTSTSPQQQGQQGQPENLIKPPLPDTVEGKVLEVERVHLTADIRQRRRFLSHLPLYTDICFVEISLGHLLSNRTKKMFKKEFQKRNQARLNKANAEKRADERVKRREEARINELKSRIQRIDPTDEFFQPAATAPVEPASMTGDDFGPSISGVSTTPTAAGILPGESRGMSFSQICRAGPISSSAPTESNFPALGSSPPSRNTASTLQAAWGRVSSSSGSPIKSAPVAASVVVSPPTSPSKGGKKSKGKKIVLFSTGAQRGGPY